MGVVFLMDYKVLVANLRKYGLQGLFSRVGVYSTLLKHI